MKNPAREPCGYKMGTQDPRTVADLAVVGAGPGGYTAAIRGAQKGLDVVLIEKERVGGVCLNHGCIPAKALIHAAGCQRDIAHWNDIGIHTGDLDADFQAIQAWKDDVVERLDQRVIDVLDHHDVRFLEGTARFLDSNALDVERDGKSETVEFDSAVVAVGSHPIEIPGLEFDQDGVISSREILQIQSVPDEIVVVGGGYIGMEAVTKFSKFGSLIKVVEARDRVLGEFEEEIVDSIQETSEMYSDHIYTSTVAETVEYEDGRPVLVADQEGEELRLSGDYVIVAAGRQTKTAFEGLQLENTDVETDERGFVETTDRMRTTDENVFCIGDAAGPPFLAHIAYRQGKVAAAVAAGEDAAYDDRCVPAVMYTDPEVAVVGLSEAEARERHDDIMVGQFSMSGSGRALTTDQYSGYVKVIADADETLLGVRIVGARASDTIAEATLALEMDATLEDIASTIHAHPTFPEALADAAEAARGESIHSC
jgi:dihydrolipoamide dehydrogenase